jgi:hypothetical protein
VYAGCASPKILKQIKVWPFSADRHDFAIYDRAGRHVGKRVCNIREFTVANYTGVSPLSG